MKRFAVMALISICMMLMVVVAIAQPPQDINRARSAIVTQSFRSAWTDAICQYDTLVNNDTLNLASWTKTYYTETWLHNWTGEWWADSVLNAVDTIFVESRTIPYVGGTWTTWAKVDTIIFCSAQGQTTIGSALGVHRWKKLFSASQTTAPFLKPFSLQLRYISKDASGKCVMHETVWSW